MNIGVGFSLGRQKRCEFLIGKVDVSKFFGSSRINVKTSELHKRSSSKIIEISETESHSYHCSQPIVETLNKPVCDSFDEVVNVATNLDRYLLPVSSAFRIHASMVLGKSPSLAKFWMVQLKKFSIFLEEMVAIYLATVSTHKAPLNSGMYVLRSFS